MSDICEYKRTAGRRSAFAWGSTKVLGQVLRPAPGKDRGRVFDYQDVNVGVLIAAAKSRQRVYDGN